MPQKVNEAPVVPRVSDGTMAHVSASESPARSRWAALRPTRRFRRLLLRAAIVLVIGVAILGGLAFAFGTIMLQYALGGLVISSIVIVVALVLTLNGVSLIWGAVVSFLALAAFGITLELVIFSRLEGRGPVAPLVASVGIGLILQNGIRAVAGTQKWLYPVPAVQDIPIAPGLGIHPVRGILTLGVGLLFVISSHILLKYTNLGNAMRATADNLELAKATGIDTRHVTFAAWGLSTAFASTAGVLLGLGSALSPTMGFDIVLLIFAAVIVGGIGSPYGAMLGGLLVGLSQEMSVPVLLWLGSSGILQLEHPDAIKAAIPFMILIVVLILRPWGIAGRRPTFARRSFFIERLSRVLGERGPLANPPSGDKGEV